MDLGDPGDPVTPRETRDAQEISVCDGGCGAFAVGRAP
jgi:hypothetical protein